MKTFTMLHQPNRAKKKKNKECARFVNVFNMYTQEIYNFNAYTSTVDNSKCLPLPTCYYNTKTEITIDEFIESTGKIDIHNIISTYGYNNVHHFLSDVADILL